MWPLEYIYNLERKWLRKIVIVQDRLLSEEMLIPSIIPLSTSSKYGSFITVNTVNQWNFTWILNVPSFFQYIFGQRDTFQMNAEHYGIIYVKWFPSYLRLNLHY